MRYEIILYERSHGLQPVSESYTNARNIPSTDAPIRILVLHHMSCV